MANPLKNKQEPNPGPFEAIQKEWRYCLPANLSDLFYVQDATGIRRVAVYHLELTTDEANAIRDLDVSKVHSIRIHMGCDKGKFAPLFEIAVADQPHPTYLLKEGNPPDVTPLSDLLPFIFDVITSGVADLFFQKWLELSDQELGDAFSGVTVENIHKIVTLPGQGTGKEDNFLLDRRVNLYTFPSSDAQQIVGYLKGAITGGQDIDVRLLLGAGLTVRVNHPFNFRPILRIPGAGSSSSLSGGKLGDPGDGTYFERSKPCPPYCDE